ncbi:KAP P-loop domain-containing protein [Acinetobacter nosocomialis]|uniref:KAP family P-loop NTPase fold protein n=2 Tax=Acinetobacter nosocomialis TaxID=106654 RepID=UPI000DE6999F|nr:P-loop NTPase fold protein [Acinetobacter nosocomialis]SSO12250.1 KAP P-loop domain-containing protein [Acinetobacter nosocomialis]SSQ55882.1 KAP P-loop domain-containing protein [Acinetobacter nosocomialis]
MSNIDKFNFSADRPIHNMNEDLLGRAKFSENLAEAISNWNGKDSLVVALYGDWGTGKSSVKNMALTYMKNITSKPMVIEFSPWEWAAQEKITKAFFNEISKSIGRENSSEKNKKLADSFKKYGNYLAAGEVILTSTSNSLPFVLSAIAGIGFFNAFLNDTKIITLITTGIVAVSPFLKWSLENLKKLAGYYDEKAKDNEKSLTEIRSELKVALQELENPILIVMDDLDRLNTSELRMIFQLIKANTEFPNVTFLLLFQRNIVEERLTDANQSGKDYLEKIIQVPFNIPKISQVQVHEVLFDRLNKILALDKNSNLHFDQDRWTQLYHAGLKNYFNNLRNVYRYTSTLAFHFSLLKGRTVFEANPVDLIAIECLRVFEPEVYNELSVSKHTFTQFQSAESTRQNNKEALKITIDSVISKAAEVNRENLKKILNELFPTIQWITGNCYYDYSSYNNWFSEGRVCHNKNFESYFQFSLSENDITKSDLVDFISLTSNENLLKSKILELNNKGKLKEFLSQFESYENQVTEDSAIPYISTLIDVGDLVNDDDTSFFDIFGAQSLIYRLIYNFLTRIDKKEKRGEILLECFKNSNEFVMIAKLLVLEQGKRNENKETLLDDLHYESIKEIFISKLKNIAFSHKDILLKNRSLLVLLYRWKEWGEVQDITDWMDLILANFQDLLKFLSQMIQNSTSYDGRSSKKHYYIKASNINNFSDVERIDQIIDNADKSKLSADEIHTIKLFKESVLRFRNGNDEDWL